MFRVVKYFIVLIWKYLFTIYLGTSINYNIIGNCCQFLMTFINRTIGVVIFKAH